MDSILETNEIAKPGSVHPPLPNANSERAETWAPVETENFTPDGIPIRDGYNLSDPECIWLFTEVALTATGLPNSQNRSRKPKLCPSLRRGVKSRDSFLALIRTVTATASATVTSA